MKPTTTVVIVAVIGVALFGVVLGLSRTSGSDQASADAEADLHATMATRLLAKYQANVSQIAQIRDQLGRQLGEGDTEVAVPPRGDEATEVVRDALEDFKVFSEDLRRRAGKSRVSQLEERLRQLAPDADDIAPLPGPELGKNEAAIAKKVASAAKELDRLTAENAKLLRRALGEADEALRVRVGEADTSQHVNASHIKAYVLHLMGDVKRGEALASRLEAQGTRQRAIRLVDRSASLLKRIQDTTERKPDQLIKRLATEKADLETRLADARKRLTGLTQQVEGQEKQIKDAEAQAQTARKALEALEAKKYDPKKPDDVERYVTEHDKQAKLQRQAALKAAALKTGTLEGVRLDDAHGGDPLKDRYVDAPGGKGRAVVKGLNQLRKQRDEVQEATADVEGMLKENAAQVDKAKALTKELESHVQALSADKAKVDEQINALLAQAGARTELAAKAETEALAQYDKADKAYNRAAQAARTRGGELTVTEAGPEMTSDKDLQVAMLIGRGDVAHARALVYLQQMRDLNREIGVLKAATAAKVQGVDEARVAQLGEAKAKAREEALKAVNTALEQLEGKGAIKSVDKNYRWIPQVSLAATLQLKSLLASGDDAAAAFDEALTQYEQAVEERKASPFLKPYVRVASRLREVGGPPGRAATRPTSGPASGPAPSGAAEPGPPEVLPVAIRWKSKVTKPPTLDEIPDVVYEVQKGFAFKEVQIAIRIESKGEGGRSRLTLAPPGKDGRVPIPAASGTISPAKCMAFLKKLPVPLEQVVKPGSTVAVALFKPQPEDAQGRPPEADRLSEWIEMPLAVGK